MNKIGKILVPSVLAAAVLLPAASAKATTEQTERDLSGYELPEDSLYLKNEVMPDTWVFTDGLGRKALTNSDVGNPREDKNVFMFYSTWHDNFAKSSKPFNVQEFLDEEQARGVDIEKIKNDYDYAGWPDGKYQRFWNTPIWGYYSTADTWVLRRQAELLANAGIDAISTDNTNGTYTWKTSYDAIIKSWTQAQKDGIKTPKLTFMLPFAGNADTNTQLEMLYSDIYSQGRGASLWYMLNGKPLIMAHPEALDRNSELHLSILDSFTFRINYPGYINNSPAYGYWGWLAVYPQAVYYASEADKIAGIAEQVTVGVAQNHNYVTHSLTAMNGENVTDRTYTSKGYDTRPDAKLYGANFAEQWEYALLIDPKTVYVTGWNEWIAGRFKEWSGTTNAFPDEYNDIASRDIEPSRGDLRDHYYYQLVNYVREYKGVRAIPEPSQAKTIDITAGVSQWNDVLPYYAAYIGDTADRDHSGYLGCRYADYSGRNDIIGSQMARDGDNIYILVECAEDITSYTDCLWMNILLDTDPENTGWEGFDYVINKTAPLDDNTAILERFTGSGYESEKAAQVSYSVSGRYLQVSLKKSDIGITGNNFTVNYSITDNVHDQGSDYIIDGSKLIYTEFTGDILDFYTSGNVAPGGRFMFCYQSTDSNTGIIPGKESETETDGVKSAHCSSFVGSAGLVSTAIAGYAAFRKKKEKE